MARRTLNGREGLSSAAFTATTLVFSISPRGAFDSHSSTDTDGFVGGGCGLSESVGGTVPLPLFAGRDVAIMIQIVR